MGRLKNKENLKVTANQGRLGNACEASPIREGESLGSPPPLQGHSQGVAQLVSNMLTPC